VLSYLSLCCYRCVRISFFCISVLVVSKTTAIWIFLFIRLYYNWSSLWYVLQTLQVTKLSKFFHFQSLLLNLHQLSSHICHLLLFAREWKARQFFLTGIWPERSKTRGGVAIFYASGQANLYSISCVLDGKITQLWHCRCSVMSTNRVYHNKVMMADGKLSCNSSSITP
jgi:hypothetical protein